MNSLPLRRADFASLADALDYAALGETGANFYSGSGKLATVVPYRTLRVQALALARRLLSIPLPRGARVAVIAETNPDFLRFFFACQYAGLVPVALPASARVAKSARRSGREFRVGVASAAEADSGVRFSLIPLEGIFSPPWALAGASRRRRGHRPEHCSRRRRRESDHRSGPLVRIGPLNGKF